MNCEQAEDNDQADLHWQYLVKKLFKLRDASDSEYIFNQEIPSQVDWLPIVDAVIHRQLEAARLHSLQTMQVIKQGWCMKTGFVNRAWKRRFLLFGKAPDNKYAELFYFTSEGSARKLIEDSVDKSAGSVNFRDVQNIACVEDLQIVDLVDSSGRQWKFKFAEPEEYVEWSRVFGQALKHVPADDHRHARTMSATQFRRVANSTFGLLLKDDELDSVFETYARVSSRVSTSSTPNAFQSMNPMMSRQQLRVAHVDEVEHVGRDSMSPTSNPLMATDAITPTENDSFGLKNPLSQHRPSTFNVHANKISSKSSKNAKRF